MQKALLKKEEDVVQLSFKYKKSKKLQQTIFAEVNVKKNCIELSLKNVSKIQLMDLIEK